MLQFHIPAKIIRLVKLAMTSKESQVRVQTKLIGSVDYRIRVKTERWLGSPCYLM
jgi:hypothetical protein